MKKYLNSFWFNNPKSIDSSGEEYVFKLEYKGLSVGTLSFYDGYWYFEYSDEFIGQTEILPLVNFPDKSKQYKSDTLWPFFATRVPSNAQLMIPDEQKTDIIQDLKNYGRRTISNPFILNPAF